MNQSTKPKPLSVLIVMACLLDAIILVLGVVFLTYNHFSAQGIGGDAWLHIFAGFGIASAISMFLDFLHRN